MRLTISPEQHKFFYHQSYLELEDLISEEESKHLLTALHNLKTKTPGYTEDNCFRSLPIILELIRKKGWGHLAGELIHKKPLRIAYDHFYKGSPQIDKIWDKDSCGFLLNLSTHRGIFFKESAEKLPKLPPDNAYFFILLTSLHLPEELNPIVAR